MLLLLFLCYFLGYMASKITKKDEMLGKRIKRLRKKIGITQEKLAEKVNVSTTHIGLIETGKRRGSLKTLQRITTVLGVKVKDILPY